MTWFPDVDDWLYLSEALLLGSRLEIIKSTAANLIKAQVPRHTEHKQSINRQQERAEPLFKYQVDSISHGCVGAAAHPLWKLQSDSTCSSKQLAQNTQIHEIK